MTGPGRSLWVACALSLVAGAVQRADAKQPPKAAQQAAPREALTQLLVDIFASPSELEQAFRYDDRLAPLVPKLPGRDAPARRHAAAAVSALVQHGLVDAALFAMLRRQVPGRAADIDRVARLWPSAPKSAAPGAANAKSAKAKTAALVQLLTSIFIGGQLAQVVRTEDRWSAFYEDLPGRGASPAQVAAAVVEQLRKRGLLDRSAFAILKQRVPGRIADIAAVERAWAPFPGEAGGGPARATSTAQSSKPTDPCPSLTAFWLRFPDHDLRRFAFHDERLRASASALPGKSASARQLASALTALVMKRHLLDAQLVQLLQALVPGRTAEIAAAGKACGGPAVATNPRSSPVSSKTLALEELLLSLFPTPSDLDQHVSYNDRLAPLRHDLPTTVSLTEKVDELIRLALRRGWVDAAFFAWLRQERPGRAADIQRVEKLWLASRR